MNEPETVASPSPSADQARTGETPEAVKAVVDHWAMFGLDLRYIRPGRQVQVAVYGLAPFLHWMRTLAVREARVSSWPRYICITATTHIGVFPVELRVPLLERDPEYPLLREMAVTGPIEVHRLEWFVGVES